MSTTYTSTSVSSDSTIDTSATVWECNISSDTTLSLPSVSGITGRMYIINRIDSNQAALTINPNGSETINGNNNYIMQGTAFVMLLASSASSNWTVLSTS
jgi:hypothetical protein